MKTAISTLVFFTLISPALALFECWDQQTVESLVAGSERVAVGFVKDVQLVGCVLPDGEIAVCPEQPIAGQFLPDQAYVVQFEITHGLKGPEGRFIEFLVFVSPLPRGCEGPGMAKEIESLVFIRRTSGRLTAWGGDYALYQRHRHDYEEVLAAAEIASRGKNSSRDRE